MQLHEQYRPSTWDEIIGQEKVLGIINRLRPRGLAGRAYFLSGPSGVGKTSIARLLVAECADPFAVEEIDATTLGISRLNEIERTAYRLRPLGRGCWCFVMRFEMRVCGSFRLRFYLLKPVGCCISFIFRFSWWPFFITPTAISVTLWRIWVSFGGFR